MQKKYLVVDAHQDIAWNMLTFDRNYTRNVDDTRLIEADTIAPRVNGDTLLGCDAYQNGRVAVVFSTLFAAPIRRKEGDWDKLNYADGNEANKMYRDQADVYHRLTDKHPRKFTLIQTKSDLSSLVRRWQNTSNDEIPPVGLVILMEGADGVRDPSELAEWWEMGVRIIGLAWAGTRYSGGTNEPGPLTKEGYQLLTSMSELGISLDISHMDEEAVLQAFDYFEGRIIASHANPKALLKGTSSNRFLSDRVIQGLIERNGIIGIVPFNRFLNRAWTPHISREKVSLDDVAAHIDYVCQMAGDTNHVGIGSDADGGFGLQSVPAEMDTIADLQKLVPLLNKKGYSEEDIHRIMGNNWTHFLEDSLPETI